MDDRALVEAMLRDAASYEWRMQDIGLLGRWLDDRRECRVHVWAPQRCDGEPLVHDHPFDFASTIVVGEMTNTRYVEDPLGEEFVRTRYLPGTEHERTTDTVHLVGAAETIGAGATYSQRAGQLHDSRQTPGTVSIIRMEFGGPRPLSVCTRDERPWTSAVSRTATADEVASITAAALRHFT
ncbi:MAG: hypothetical protein U0W40_05455 [Acidimicrobiia bacterium]